MSLSTVGRVCLFGSLGLASGANPQEPTYHRLVVGGSLAALASTVAFKFNAYITTPSNIATPEPEPATPPPLCSTDAKDPKYRVIPGNSGHIIRTLLNESDCQMLAGKFNPQDPMTFEAFQILGETQGISPDNRLAWQEKFSPFMYTFRSYGWPDGPSDVVFPSEIQASDLPQQPAMWGTDNNGNLFITVKYTVNKVEDCVAIFFHHPRLRPNSLLTAAELSSDRCRPGPFYTVLEALLQGKEVRAGEKDIVTLAKPASDNSPSSDSQPLLQAIPPEPHAQEVPS